LKKIQLNNLTAEKFSNSLQSMTVRKIIVSESKSIFTNSDNVSEVKIDYAKIYLNTK